MGEIKLTKSNWKYIKQALITACAFSSFYDKAQFSRLIDKFHDVELKDLKIKGEK